MVTVDVIFHKVKPQGGRRLLYPNYLKALSAAAEEANMNVFELIGLLGMQIKPSKTFVAPQVRRAARSVPPVRASLSHAPLWPRRARRVLPAH